MEFTQALLIVIATVIAAGCTGGLIAASLAVWVCGA